MSTFEQATADFIEPRAGWRTWLAWAIFAALVGLSAWLILRNFFDVRGVAVRSPPQISIEMLPPPPPPPPPPPEPTPKPPEPTPAAASAAPTPTPTPKATADNQAEAAASMEMDATAQAGENAFGLRAGSGDGMGAPGGGGTCKGSNCGNGGGFADGLYAQYLSGILQERIQDNAKVNRLLFTAEFAVVVDAAGRVTAAELVRSTGNVKRDELIRIALENIRGLDAPPATLRWPQKITVKGRSGF